MIKTISDLVREAVEGERESVCLDCGIKIDWEGEGGIVWAGDVFCELHDPLSSSVEEDN
jgi:hypothetical protein